MTTASTPAVEVQNVSKWYGSVVAVNEASFDIYPGVTGILGPNGAGKTTLLSMMCGLVKPSRGSVRVLGEEVQGNIGLYRRLGVMLEHDVLYPFMTGRDFVRLAARLQGMNDEAAVDRAIHAANLEDAQHRATGTYSRGMRQRIRLAGAIVHEPDVLILDEPLNGTDPRQRVEFADFVARLSMQGKAILISSHILEEVEALADRILLVVSGKLAAAGDFHAIREKLDERPFQVRIGASKQREMAAALVALDAVESVSLDEFGNIEVLTRNVAELQRMAPKLAQEIDSRLYRIEPLDDSLESVFSYVVQR
ncbi:MAG: ABC transporter ATP-binding protein [Chloroflexi bacterium]|nr:ABC transporter ATP-binding protein [Chloroflexota bacterium]